MQKKKDEKVINVLIIIGYIVIIPILLINLIIIGKSIASPQKIPDLFGYKPFIVLSDSMGEVINKGDLVIVKIVDYNSLNKNDIIAFRNGDIVITHRIIDVNYDENGEKYYVTKGDNIDTEDNDLVRNYDVEGKYVTKIAKLGSVLLFLGSPSGVVIIILLILLIVFIINSLYQKKENKKDKKELEEYRKIKD